MKHPRIHKIPNGSTKDVGVGMEVEPITADLHTWRWRTFFTFNGGRSLTSYDGGSGWQHPSPYEVVGETGDEGTAWDRARQAADNARERWAAEQVRMGRKSSDHVPL